VKQVGTDRKRLRELLGGVGREEGEVGAPKAPAEGPVGRRVDSREPPSSRRASQGQVRGEKIRAVVLDEAASMLCGKTCPNVWPPIKCALPAGHQRPHQGPDGRPWWMKSVEDMPILEDEDGD
jgi:hypothetical protein